MEDWNLLAELRRRYAQARERIAFHENDISASLERRSDRSVVLDYEQKLREWQGVIAECVSLAEANGWEELDLDLDNY